MPGSACPASAGRPADAADTDGERPQHGDVRVTTFGTPHGGSITDSADCSSGRASLR